MASQVAEAVVAHDLRRFLLLYEDAPLLLVSTDGDVEMARQLEASEPAGVLPFTTEEYSSSPWRPPPGTPDAFGPEEPAQFAELLAKAPYFALPLRKRPASDNLYADRISVGRARNKDVVLRHASVSKFHAWFEVGDKELFVADAESKNLTRLNGETLLPREKAPIKSGNAVSFGAIDCVVCSASVLWTCLRAPAWSDRKTAGAR
jgi:hypothetical protein